MFLINSCQGIFRCGPACAGQALSLTYGRFFAEFLEDLLLVHLGLLDQTTCVGLRYGRTYGYCLEVFLETALSALSPSVEGNCTDTRDNAYRICLVHALMQVTPIQ